MKHIGRLNFQICLERRAGLLTRCPDVRTPGERLTLEDVYRGTEILWRRDHDDTRGSEQSRQPVT